MRGLLKTFGLLVGKVSEKRFEARLRALISDDPMLAGIFEPLLAVRATVWRELDADASDAMIWRPRADHGENHDPGNDKKSPGESLT